MSWFNAERFCQEHNGILASPTTEAEQKFLEKKYGIGDFWIGLTDSKEEGKFKLLLGDVLGDYKNWKKGRPQSGSNSADCVSMSSADKWKWVDGSCYDRKDAYCKIDCKLEIFCF